MPNTNLPQANAWMHNANLLQYKLIKTTTLSGTTYAAGTPIYDAHTFKLWASWKVNGHLQFMNDAGKYAPRRPEIVASTPWKTYRNHPLWPRGKGAQMVAKFIGGVWLRNKPTQAPTMFATQYTTTYTKTTTEVWTFATSPTTAPTTAPTVKTTHNSRLHCNTCGCTIPIERIFALPTTTTCVKCSNVQSRRHYTFTD